jgi:hypothetical protein
MSRTKKPSIPIEAPRHKHPAYGAVAVARDMLRDALPSATSLAMRTALSTAVSATRIVLTLMGISPDEIEDQDAQHDLSKAALASKRAAA